MGSKEHVHTDTSLRVQQPEDAAGGFVKTTSVPSADLARQGGRIAENGTILVSRPIPFKLWFCVPKEEHRTTFDLIYDEKLEDELVLGYYVSPILAEFKRECRRTSRSWQGKDTTPACNRIDGVITT